LHCSETGDCAVGYTFHPATLKHEISERIVHHGLLSSVTS
jgi:hypothetical protein